MNKNLIFILMLIIFSSALFMCSGNIGNEYMTATGKSPEKNIQKIGIPAEIVSFDYPVPDGMIEDEAEKQAMINAKIEHLRLLNSKFWGEVEFDEDTLEFAFESTWDEINNKFIGFKNLDVDWDAVYDEYIGKITQVKNYGEYAYIITLMTYLLQDIHANAIPGRLTSEIIDDKGEKKQLDIPNRWLKGAPVFTPDATSKIGACHTLTENGELVIVKVTDSMSNPYNFKLGDEIVGFNGIPWKDWYPILEKVGIPIDGNSASNPKAIEYFKGKSAGANITLFEKVNIKRIDTGEIETIDVQRIDEMYRCTDITEVNGLKEVENPNKSISVIKAVQDGDILTYGIIENENIGYVYLAECPAGFDEVDYGAGEEWDPYETEFSYEFEEAILSLMDTDGLIIDLRNNLGGRSEPMYRAWSHLIKGDEDHQIYNGVERDAGSDDKGTLKPIEDERPPFIADNPDQYYENPIIVMTGPDCVSACDYTIGFLSRYPETFTIIGESNNGSFSGAGLDGYTADILDEDYNMIDYIWRRLPEVTSTYSDNPDIVLRTENFIDIAVWFNKEDVKNGIDTIREYAIKLIKENQ